jgi:amino acid permease
VQLGVVSLQFGVCAVLLNTLATNLCAATSLALGKDPSLLCVAAVCALLSMARDLSMLAPLSAIGNAAFLVVVATIVVVSLVEIAEAGGAGGEPVPPLLPPAAPLRPPSAPLPSGLALAAQGLSACFYSFEGVALVLPVANELHPSSTRSYPNVLTLVVLLIGLSFGMVGALGGMAFPGIDDASITAFLALKYRSAPTAPFFEAINGLVSFAVLTAFPLQLTPLSLIVEARLGLSSLTHRRICRLVLITLAALLVLSVSRLDQLIDLVGSICDSLLAALPFLFQLRILQLEAAERGLLRPAAVAQAAFAGAYLLFCVGVAVFGVWGVFYRPPSE